MTRRLEEEALKAIDRELLADAYTSDQALRQLETICDRFGGRFAGSPGGEAAAGYLAEQLKAWGLANVRLEAFPHLAWERGSCRLTLLAPREERCPDREVIALPHTGTVAVEGELRFIGAGTPTEFAAYADQLAGRIVMVTARNPGYHRRTLHRREKLARARELGARAVLYMRDTGGLLPETGSTATNRASPLPVVGVSKELGERLRRLAREGEVRLRIETENALVERRLHNVIGDLPGDDLGEKVVLTGAHYDGHDVGEAASDNGSGTVVTLEAARLLARHGGFAKTLRFVFFGGEEVGLLGARAYVETHALDELELMLNLDGAGSGGMKGIGLQGWPELIPYFRAMAGEMKHPMVVDCAYSWASDHLPFVRAGVPAMMLRNMGASSGVRGFNHTAADTVDKVSLRDLQRPAAQVARLLLRLASRDDFPAAHKDPDEMRELIAREGMLEPLELARRSL